LRVLLDSSVLRALRSPSRDEAVRSTLAPLAADNLFLSVLTVGELASAIELVVDRRKKRDLATWLTGLESHFADRILPVSYDVAHRWGELTACLAQRNLILPVVDGLLAATALCHGLHFVTHETEMLSATWALILDPWRVRAESSRSEPVVHIE
jgi:predicted nucleic acid-binding protein